jgi:hypothetical protein
LAKSGVREVGGEMGEEEEDEVVESMAASPILVGWDAQKAATCRVGKVVAGGEEEVGLKCPGVGAGRGVMVAGGVEAAFSIELNVFVQMPVLQSKSEALVMEPFWVELVLRVARNEDQVVVKSALGAV